MATHPLNISGKEFLNTVGLPYHGEILKILREEGLVNFFKVGNKYLYHFEDVKTISDKLRRNEIRIKTDNGTYYITKTA